MPVILNIDTSSEICSVCLSYNGNIIVEKNNFTPNQHAAHLTNAVAETVKSAGITLKDLSAIALSNGPGSYTGLRIGASVAKGFCYGLNKPLIAVSTLQAIAQHMAIAYPDPEGIYVGMLDARRDNVYMAIYDAGNNVIEKNIFITLDSSFQNRLLRYSVKNIYFAGTGAAKLHKCCLNIGFGTVIENIICVASNINTISYKLFQQKIFDDISTYEPFYLKEFEGRIKYH